MVYDPNPTVFTWPSRVSAALIRGKRESEADFAARRNRRLLADVVAAKSLLHDVGYSITLSKDVPPDIRAAEEMGAAKTRHVYKVKHTNKGTHP